MLVALGGGGISLSTPPLIPPLHISHPRGRPLPRCSWSRQAIERLERGVALPATDEDAARQCAPCQVEVLAAEAGATTLRVGLGEGRNRQV